MRWPTVILPATADNPAGRRMVSAGLHFPQIVLVFVGRYNDCLLHPLPEEALRSDAHAVSHGNNAIGSGEGSTQRCPLGPEVSGVFELILLTGDCRPADDELFRSVHRSEEHTS